jgi:uncharacterized integral membrane protein
MRIKLVTACAVLVLLLVFALQNAAVIDIRFFWWDIRISRSLLIFVVLLTGVVLGWFTGSMVRLRKRHR